MNKTNLLIKDIKDILLQYCPRSYFWHALINYPRLEFTVRQLDVSFAEKFILTINLFDKKSFVQINQIADTIDDEVGQATYESDSFYFKLYRNNDRQIIDESDNDIAHLMWTYEVRFYWKDEINE